MDVSFSVRRPAVAATRVRDLVKAVLDSERVRDALISVAFVSIESISRLNRNFLSRTGPTDVIAFGFARQDKSLPVIGDIYICQTIAQRNARALRVALKEEVSRLVVHGTLHVLGYDHSDGDHRTSSAMWRKQEGILAGN